MSKILTLAPGETNSVQIEKPMAGVYLTGLIPFNNAPQTSAQILSWISDELAKIVVTATYKRKNGDSETLYNALPLNLLAEFAQYEEGVIQSWDDAITAEAYLYLPFSMEGSMQFDNDQTMLLEFTNTCTSLNMDV